MQSTCKESHDQQQQSTGWQMHPHFHKRKPQYSPPAAQGGISTFNLARRSENWLDWKCVSLFYLTWWVSRKILNSWKCKERIFHPALVSMCWLTSRFLQYLNLPLTPEKICGWPQSKSELTKYHNAYYLPCNSKHRRKRIRGCKTFFFMLCIFFGIGKITTLGKAMCLFCLKDTGSQINVTAASQSSSHWCPNYKWKKKRKRQDLWKWNVIPHPNTI